MLKQISSPVCLRGREWAEMPPRQQEALVESAFGYWRQRGFPYFRLSEAQVFSEFNYLKSKKPNSVFRRDGVHGSTAGLRIANTFQPQMWSVRVSRYRSPMDVFQDDDLLRKAIRRSWSIWPDRFGANASSLRRILKTFPGTAGVSNFRPTLARAVADRFSAQGGTVIDFAAGYGGRLVGCISLEREYIGIEPCDEQVNGLGKTIAALSKTKAHRASGTILHGCAEEVLPSLPTASADLVFSSPPFYDWEQYSEQPSQSYLRYTSYQEWLRGFLGLAIAESGRILKPRGYLVLNIPKRYRRPAESDVIHLAIDSGLQLHTKLPLLLARVPYLHPRGAGPFKSELLIAFHKR